MVPAVPNAFPASRAAMSVTYAAVGRASRAMASRVKQAPCAGGYPFGGSVYAARLTGTSGVSKTAPFANVSSRRGVAATCLNASNREFVSSNSRIVSHGHGNAGKGGVVWVPATAGVGGGGGGMGGGRAFETTAGAGSGAGAGAGASPPQQYGTPQQPNGGAAYRPAQNSSSTQQQQQRRPPSAAPPGSQNQPGVGSSSNSNSHSQSFQPPTSAPPSPSPQNGPRIFVDFAVYKSKAAVKFGVIKPTFEVTQATGTKQKKRDGGLLLEFAPAVGQRAYDWGNKQSILLSPLELVELCETLAVLGKGVVFFHDPGMGTAKQGTMTKSLKAEPMPDGSGGVFLNLSTSTGAKLNVAVSFAEFCVLRNLTQYLVPRLMGFDEVFKG